jgi:hypothetical protein
LSDSGSTQGVESRVEVALLVRIQITGEPVSVDGHRQAGLGPCCKRRGGILKALGGIEGDVRLPGVEDHEHKHMFA